jgi:uncharacterized circularly permuted ATP-grasp superfamily protein
MAATAALAAVIFVVGTSALASTLREDAAQRTSVVADDREQQLARAVGERGTQTLSLAASPAIRDAAVLLDGAAPSSPSFLTAYDSLRRSLQSIRESDSNLLEIQFARSDGTVFFSTSPESEGRSLGAVPYFRGGLQGLTVYNAYTVDGTTPEVFYAAPLFTPDLRRIGVVVIRTGLADLAAVLADTTGLDEGGTAHLVTRGGRVLSSVGEGPSPIGSVARTAVAQGGAGSGTYRGTSGETVVGAYRWLPERELGLIVEVPESAVLGAARTLGWAIGIGGVLAVALVGGGGVVLARQAARKPRDLSGVTVTFGGYETDGFYDELVEPGGRPRASAALLADRIESLAPGELLGRQAAAEQALLELGITFNVYGDEAGTEKIFPFDVIPRIVGADDWDYVERGLKQRIQALNLFIDDIYHDQRIVKAGVVPEHMIGTAGNFLEACVGIDPPQGVWCHITGTDLVRDSSGQFYVLEDNLRTPSGVSYVLENRQVLKATFPDVFEKSKVRPIDDYPSRLLETLQYISPRDDTTPIIAVLTPGIYNSAYFEHAFLAQQMGAELVEGRDLIVQDDVVYMETTRGRQRIDVIYRRIDDDFLDPLVFNPESVLGVAGLIDAYRAGNIGLANAPGTGVADDKAIYTYVPDMVKYYLGEDIILPNVETFACWDDQQREYVLANLDKLVVKETDGSGGYGMLIGPHATAAERKDFAKRIRAEPRKYIAQPTLDLSRAPVIVEDHLEGRHLDLRPYILHGRDVYVLPGGLTRVALRRGSLVVNSSQGGGSKDSWVLAAESPDAQ